MTYKRNHYFWQPKYNCGECSACKEPTNWHNEVHEEMGWFDNLPQDQNESNPGSCGKMVREQQEEGDT